MPARALDAIIRGQTVRDVSRNVLALSRRGLEARGLFGCRGKHKSAFLDVLDEAVTSVKTAADQLDLYHSNWNGDISRVFRDFAYRS